VGFVGVCKARGRGLRRFETRNGTDGIFQKKLLALATEQEELHDFCEDALAGFAGGGVVGAFYRTSRAEALEGSVELAEECGLALNEEAVVGAIGTQVGVLFVHVGIDFVAKGVVMLKSGKRVHRAEITASAVPRAEGLTTEDTEGTERIFWLKFIEGGQTSGALLAAGDAMARGKKSAPTERRPPGNIW
jgi:hypothetical protein